MEYLHKMDKYGRLATKKYLLKTMRHEITQQLLYGSIVLFQHCASSRLTSRHLLENETHHEHNGVLCR